MVAAITTVVQISGHIISVCHQYARIAKDAKKDIVDVITVVGEFKSALENLLPFIQDDAESEHVQLPRLKTLARSIQRSKDSLKELATGLGIQIEKDIDPDKITVPLIQKLMWP